MYVQTYGLTQEVAPVYPIPAHCPHSGTVPVPVPVEVVPPAVLVEVAVEPPLPPPPKVLVAVQVELMDPNLMLE